MSPDATRQGALTLTSSEVAAEVEHRGQHYQLRRWPSGGWEVWRRGPDGWKHAQWLRADLKWEAKMAELCDVMGARNHVPSAVLHALAEKVRQ